jgi:hypothetical protein
MSERRRDFVARDKNAGDVKQASERPTRGTSHLRHGRT